MGRGRIPDKPADRPTVPEVVELARRCYAKPGNGVGGTLHAILDDGNIEDLCLTQSREYCERTGEAEPVSATAKNLEALWLAVVRHNGNCGSPLLEIRMSPFEVERLGWEEFRGIPIVADDQIGTGRFRLVCEGDHKEAPTRTEAIGRGLITVNA